MRDDCDSMIRWRPYRVECTGSLLTSEVKRRKARLVLGWGTAWEHPRVLPAFCFGAGVFDLDETAFFPCVGGSLAIGDNLFLQD